MNIYAQHGYGKSNKIEAALRANDLSGVIIRPRDEKPEKLNSYLRDLRTEFGDNIEILFDPQFYLSTRSPVQDGNLPDYPFYQTNLSWSNFIAPNDIRSYVSSTIDFQVPLQVDRILSPSVFVSNFEDRWYAVALQLAQESINYHEQLNTVDPLLLSFVLSEGALQNKRGLDEFLDIVTIWNAQGFYLIVSLSDTNYPAKVDSEVVANYMYLVYVLSENGFEVVCGYSDLLSLLLHSVGANATATGWFNTLRQFSIERFQPSTGGRRPVPRYTSAPLLNSIKIIPELQSIQEIGMLDSVLSHTTYDQELDPRNLEESWLPRTSCLHHWQALTGLAGAVSSQGSVRENLLYIESLINDAIDNYRTLEDRGVLFEPSSGRGNLETWNEAINRFRSNVRL